MLVSRDTIFELLLQLDILTLQKFCSSSKQINKICQEPILWQKLLERDFNKRYLSSDAQAVYFRYQAIIKFFTPMFPIITDLAVEIIDQYVPKADWDGIAKMFERNMAEDENWYAEILDWDQVKSLIYSQKAELDPKYWENFDAFDYPLGIEITDYVKNYFANQLRQFELSTVPTITFWENKVATTPQIIYVKGEPLIVTFNYDLLKLTDRLRFEYLQKQRRDHIDDDEIIYQDFVSEEFDIELTERLVALLE